MEAHVIQGGVVQATLVRLHLGLDAADSSKGTLLAPGAKLSPVHARPIQLDVATAAEPDVVSSCVVTQNTPVGIYTKLERGEHTSGAELNTSPLAKAGERREQKYTG